MGNRQTTGTVTTQSSPLVFSCGAHKQRPLSEQQGVSVQFLGCWCCSGKGAWGWGMIPEGGGNTHATAHTSPFGGGGCALC